MKIGDIVIFYRSGDFRSVTSIGVIDELYENITDSDEVLKYVGKRTVYSRLDIEEMAQSPLKVILFRHHFHLKRPIQFSELIEIGALAGPPQTITEITNQSYQEIKYRGGVDERYTVC